MSDVIQGGWVFMVKQASGAAEMVPSFMCLSQQTLTFFKRNPQSHPNEDPMFSGFLNKETDIAQLGRKLLPNGQVLHLFSVSQKETERKLELGCSAAEAAHDWVSAIESAASLSVGPSAGSSTYKGDLGCASFKNGTAKFMPIGGAQAHLGAQSRMPLGDSEDEEEDGDNTRWKLIRLMNGLRIFEGLPLSAEDWVPTQRLLKAEGIVEAEPDRIFEMIINLSDASRMKWDPFTETAEVVELLDGYTDVIKSTFNITGKGGKYVHREMACKRSWRRNEDGSYVMSLEPNESTLKNITEKSSRLESAVYTWDIVPICGNSSSVGSSFRNPVPTTPYSRSLVRFVMEVQQKSSTSHTHTKFRLPFFKGSHGNSNDEKKREKERSVVVQNLGSFASIPSPATHKERERDRDFESLADPGAFEEYADGLAMALVSRIAGLREYFASLPPPKAGPNTMGEVLNVRSFSGVIVPGSTGQAAVGGEEFFDALELTVVSDSEGLKKFAARKRWARIKWLVRFGLLIHSLRNDSMGATGLSWNIARELLHNCPPIDLDALTPKLSALGSVPLLETMDAAAQHACRDPGGGGFNVRGPNYLLDRLKVAAGDPLLKLVGVDWFTSPDRVDNVAARPKCLVQSEAGKAAPFIFVVNLQVPGPPCYSLVAYFASDRPIRAHPRSLLHRFYTSTDDEFRNARFKLMPRIAEGHWMVKRAVGTKPAILGRALKCSYFKGRNYLEMDCDIGSSSVARNVLGLVISYVTSLVVDLVLLIEAQEEEDLPEYLLAAFTCIKLDTKKAVPPPPEASEAPEVGV